MANDNESPKISQDAVFKALTVAAFVFALAAVLWLIISASAYPHSQNLNKNAVPKFNGLKLGKNDSTYNLPEQTGKAGDILVLRGDAKALDWGSTAAIVDESVKSDAKSTSKNQLAVFNNTDGTELTNSTITADSFGALTVPGLGKFTEDLEVKGHTMVADLKVAETVTIGVTGKDYELPTEVIPGDLEQFLQVTPGQSRC